MKSKAKQKGVAPSENRSDVADTEAGEDYGRRLAWCQRALRGLTVAIMVSFLLIIAMTTASTGAFVQVTAKALYHLILLAALVSLVTWAIRVRMEKKMSQGTGASTEVMKRA